LTDQFIPPPNPIPESTVWPPPPTGVSSPDEERVILDIRLFQVQNSWLMFLLMTVTLGLYGPFWMIRVAKVVNRMVPERTIPDGMIWTLLGLEAFNLLSSFVILAFATHLPSTVTTGLVSDVLTALGFASSIYWWVMTFKFRAALNRVLERTSPHLRRFGIFGTFFIGELYLQICLNHRIKEQSAQYLALQ